MNIEELREYCVGKKGVTESFPFDETTLVFKVAGKMFCLTDLEGDLFVNLKNEPEKNQELREQYPAIKPGYHMNKQHWNTVSIDDSVSDEMIKQLIDDSYKLIVSKLPKKIREELNNV
ncbi:Predicted DNA-binding protein, MmcQ/YjbR family [Mariniphaga anaerophila]|uniref:Predicted DNA-binding protein, MmcQ/YjbR family n=1 Tax=Mariniphaga anaerophila TaxID=1484053 RepID=A0A1M5BGW8_9BACT|nr:MmcQ/YjbR family DNA-binding protein [Mariniphaga anaerophila]SHF41462.1 Predicted DNA-binding protein, MmcQ/YjbR family [Mariniphaga anaerophila]